MKIFTTDDVNEFIRNLDLDSRTKTTRNISLLEQFTYKLSMPFSKKIGPNLYELRTRGKIEIRIFYSFSKNNIILFYAYIKKTNKIPKRVLKMIETKSKSLDI